jgi:transposase-like protein
VADRFILCSDGPKGLGEAIEQVWPLAEVQRRGDA